MENQTNQQQKTPSENTENKQSQNQQTIELLRGKADVLDQARLRPHLHSVLF